MLLIFGLTHCDTVRRARAWLSQQGASYDFHDFSRAGVPAKQLDRWIEELGTDALINRRGTTWRRLDAGSRESCDALAGARACMLANPSLIRRPVVHWPAGPITVGFNPSIWQTHLGLAG